jgi:hypothetical protein
MAIHYDVALTRHDQGERAPTLDISPRDGAPTASSETWRLLVDTAVHVVSTLAGAASDLVRVEYVLPNGRWSDPGEADASWVHALRFERLLAHRAVPFRQGDLARWQQVPLSTTADTAGRTTVLFGVGVGGRLHRCADLASHDWMWRVPESRLCANGKGGAGWLPDFRAPPWPTEPDCGRVLRAVSLPLDAWSDDEWTGPRCSLDRGMLAVSVRLELGDPDAFATNMEASDLVVSAIVAAVSMLRDERVNVFGASLPASVHGCDHGDAGDAPAYRLKIQGGEARAVAERILRECATLGMVASVEGYDEVTGADEIPLIVSIDGEVFRGLGRSAAADGERVVYGPYGADGQWEHRGVVPEALGAPPVPYVLLEVPPPVPALALAFDPTLWALQQHEELVSVGSSGTVLDEGAALVRALRHLEANGALDAADLTSLTGVQRTERLERRLEALKTKMPFAFASSTAGKRRVWRVVER